MALKPRPELTKREREVSICIAEGLSHKQIATKLNISVKTVEFHTQLIHEKLGVTGPAAITRHAIKTAWIEP